MVRVRFNELNGKKMAQIKGMAVTLKGSNGEAEITYNGEKIPLPGKFQSVVQANVAAAALLKKLGKI